MHAAQHYDKVLTLNYEYQSCIAVGIQLQVLQYMYIQYDYIVYVSNPAHRSDGLHYSCTCTLLHVGAPIGAPTHIELYDLMSERWHGSMDGWELVGGPVG